MRQRRVTPRFHLLHGIHGLESDRFDLACVLGRLRAHRDRLAGLPAVRREIVRNARRDVRQRVPQINASVAILVLRPLRDAGRHELAPAHRAGVRAFQLVDRIREMHIAEQEQLLELAAEKRRARRIVECERRQRIEHAVLAGHAAVAGFDADDRDDDLGRHAVFLADSVEQLAIGAIELDAVVDALVADEDRPVILPRLGRFGRTRDRVENALLHLCAGERRQHARFGRSACARDFRREGLLVGSGRCRRRGRTFARSGGGAARNEGADQEQTDTGGQATGNAGHVITVSPGSRTTSASVTDIRIAKETRGDFSRGRCAK